MKLPQPFVFSLSEYINTSDLPDDKKQHYVTMLQTPEIEQISAEDWQSFFHDVEMIVRKFEQDILLNGDPDEIEQLTQNKQAYYAWMNEVEERALRGFVQAAGQSAARADVIPESSGDAVDDLVGQDNY